MQKLIPIKVPLRMAFFLCAVCVLASPGIAEQLPVRHLHLS
jgi:hypothetical protein